MSLETQETKHSTSLYRLQQGRAPGFDLGEEVLGDGRLRWLGGMPGTAREERWFFTLSRGGERLWRAAVLFEPGGPFVSGLVWEEAGVALLGGGSTLCAVELESGAERLRRPVDMYFGSFELDPELAHLYVCGGTNIQKFDRDLNCLWTSEPIAVDGITGVEFQGQSLHVMAERDPPGGWVPVVLDVRTGRATNRHDPV